jgi:hypothetical protein
MLGPGAPDLSRLYRVFKELNWRADAPEGKRRPTILLVDSDLGFIFCLGQALEAAGYSAIPAKDVQSAYELITEHRLSIDTVVIDPFVPNAFAFTTWLRRLRPGLKVIVALPEDWGSLPTMTGVDAVMRKPPLLTAVATLQWIGLIQNLSSSSGDEPPLKISKLQKH